MQGVPSPRDTEAGGCFWGADIAASAASAAAAAGAGEQTELCSFSALAARAGGGEWDRRRMSSGMEIAQLNEKNIIREDNVYSGS